MKFSRYDDRLWHITQGKVSLCGHRGLVQTEIDDWDDETWDFYIKNHSIGSNDCGECRELAKLICQL